jgi:isoaspartyl peptidase/L-asparaginase-like protein (Ntn-hydrolase superfamily)
MRYLRAITVLEINPAIRAGGRDVNDNGEGIRCPASVADGRNEIQDALIVVDEIENAQWRRSSRSA